MSRCFLACALTAAVCLSACSNADRGSSKPAASPTASAPIPAAGDAIHRIAVQDGASDSSSEMKLVIESPDGKREGIDFRVRRGYTPESVSTLLQVTSPREETDKALLSIEKAGSATVAYSYLAGLKKVASLSSMSTLTLRGTKITIQELLWLELSQYQASTGERITENGVPLLKYSLSAPPERTLAFPRIVAVFREADMTPLKFELFDEGDKLQKTVRIEEVRSIDNHQVMTRVSIEDHVQNKKLLLTTSSVKFNTGLAEKLFTQESLISIIDGASQRILEGK